MPATKVFAPCDRLIDLGAMGGIGGGELGVGRAGRLHIALLERGKERLLGDLPEADGRLMSAFGQRVANIEVLLEPEGVARVVVLAQCREALAPRRRARRVVQRQRRLEIGFDDVLGRGQDVGDEILAEDDARVRVAAHLELLQCVVARGQKRDAAGNEESAGELGDGADFHWDVPGAG